MHGKQNANLIFHSYQSTRKYMTTGIYYFSHLYKSTIKWKRSLDRYTYCMHTRLLPLLKISANDKYKKGQVANTLKPD